MERMATFFHCPPPFFWRIPELRYSNDTGKFPQYCCSLKRNLSASLPFMIPLQTTIRKALHFHGIGLHTAHKTRLTLLPSPPNTGILFTLEDQTLPAVFENITHTTPTTVLSSPRNPSVTLSTVAHLLAALSASNVDNVRAEVSAAELPFMDGSAAPFATALADNVCKLEGMPRKKVRVRKHVAVGNALRYVRFGPWEHSDGLWLDVTSRQAGLQRVSMELEERRFRAYIARARQCWFRREVEELRKEGFIKGGIVDCAVVMEEDGRVVSDGGLRYADEVCRHQLLDYVGLLRLGGCFAARFEAVGPAQALILQLLRELYRDPSNYCIE